MQIKTYVLGELQTNTYLVFDEKTKDGLVIDPADDANFICEQILVLGIKLKAIVATHGHFDHLLAANELQLAFKAPFLINKEDWPILKKMTLSATWWLKRRITEKIPQKIEFLTDGDTLKIGQTLFKIIHTPGHSPGGICLYAAKEKVLFTGDTLFAHGTVGRTDLPYSSPKELQNSLAKLALLPREVRIYPGHGENSSLGESLNQL